jgi:hypothetical protein
MIGKFYGLAQTQASLRSTFFGSNARYFSTAKALVGFLDIDLDAFGFD